MPAPATWSCRCGCATATPSSAFFTTVATFGTPLDVTVAELAIESFFPADPHTAAVLAGRGAAPAR